MPCKRNLCVCVPILYVPSILYTPHTPKFICNQSTLIFFFYIKIKGKKICHPKNYTIFFVVVFVITMSKPPDRLFLFSIFIFSFMRKKKMSTRGLIENVSIRSRLFIMKYFYIIYYSIYLL